MGTAPGLHLLQAYQGWRGAARAEQHLERELAAGREHPDRARERLGETNSKRSNGPLVWFHAGTHAEALAMRELIERLAFERDGVNFLITTATYDPEMGLDERLPSGVVHQYLPYDMGAGIKAFLNHWQPDTAVWSDRILRPKIIEGLSARGIRFFMIDAWMPDDRQQRWRWFPGTAKSVLRRFTRILASDDQTAGNLRRLGVQADRIEVTGFLQEGSPPLPCLQSERDALGELLAARPVWLAAGIDIREEKIVIAAHRHAARRSHRLLLILVPDDTQRGPDLANGLEADGWVVAVRSREEEPEPDVQIYIADLPDELGLWYRLAPTCFMGQSLEKGPGRNPYEATALGSAVLYGPNVTLYRESYERLKNAGAAREVRDKKSLASAVEFLLSPDKAAEMAAAAWEISTNGAEVTDRIRTLVLDALDAQEG